MVLLHNLDNVDRQLKSFSHKISDASDALLNDYKNLMSRINTIESELFSCCQKSEEKQGCDKVIGRLSRLKDRDGRAGFSRWAFATLVTFYFSACFKTKSSKILF